MLIYVFVNIPSRRQLQNDAFLFSGVIASLAGERNLNSDCGRSCVDCHNRTSCNQPFDIATISPSIIIIAQHYLAIPPPCDLAFHRRRHLLLDFDVDVDAFPNVLAPTESLDLPPLLEVELSPQYFHSLSIRSSAWTNTRSSFCPPCTDCALSSSRPCRLLSVFSLFASSSTQRKTSSSSPRLSPILFILRFISTPTVSPRSVSFPCWWSISNVSCSELPSSLTVRFVAFMVSASNIVLFKVRYRAMIQMRKWPSK